MVNNSDRNTRPILPNAANTAPDYPETPWFVSHRSKKRNTKQENKQKLNEKHVQKRKSIFYAFRTPLATVIPEAACLKQRKKKKQRKNGI